MSSEYYDSELTAEQIEQALNAIHGVIAPANNGKVLAVENGVVVAKSVSEWGQGGYPEPTGTIQISSNGTVNVKDYASAEVNVPSGITAADEGKVVKNGALILQTTRATDITANGTYDTTENNSVTVNVSGGGGTVDRTLMNYLLAGTTNESLKIKNGKWLYGFATYNYMKPADSSGNILKPNWSLPFEIQVQFRLQGSVSRSMVLFGAQQDFYYCPSIEVAANNSGIWCGLSTNGSSWTNSIVITSSDGITLALNTPIRINAVWDGTDYTVTIYDGINTVSKSVTPSSSPYYNSSYNLEFGGIAKSSSHYAQHVEIDLENTYMKQNGDMIWGCDAA